VRACVRVRATTYCNILQHTATHCNNTVKHHTATQVGASNLEAQRCNKLLHDSRAQIDALNVQLADGRLALTTGTVAICALCYSVLQCVAVSCFVLHCVASGWPTVDSH